MDWNIYLIIQKPVYQALFFLLLTILLILVIRPNSADKAWLISVYAFILFLIVNAGMLWFSVSPWRYFFYSLGFAIAYIVSISVVMPFLERVLKFYGSGESAMAFLVLIYHPFALLLVMLVKWMVIKWF